MFLDDTALISWEISRYNRYHTGIVRNAWPAALQSILKQLSFKPDYLQNSEAEEQSNAAAKAFFHDAEARKEVMETLHRFGLNEDAVEAEAFRLKIDDLERVDKMLVKAERRRCKALQFIADYRQSLALQIRRATDRMIAESARSQPVGAA